LHALRLLIGQDLSCSVRERGFTILLASTECKGRSEFDDLFHLVDSLEHDFKDEEQKRVHSLSCRRCAISVRLSAFKTQIIRILRDIDFVTGDSEEKNGRP
jgi:hypothetical protein